MERKTNYTKDFKVKACESVTKDGISVKTVADKLEIGSIMLYRQIDECKICGDSAFVGKGKLRPEDAKLKCSERENYELKQQVEILKKQRHTLRRKAKTIDFCKKMS